MSILMQIIFGTFVGWMLAKPWTNKRLDVFLGVMGTMSGSLVMNSFGLPGVYSYDLYSFFVAMFWAVLIILIGRGLQRTSQAGFSQKTVLN